MTVQTINTRPFTLNILYDDAAILTKCYSNAVSAIQAARVELTQKNTVHATVTNERTGIDLFDCPGEFV